MEELEWLNLQGRQPQQEHKQENLLREPMLYLREGWVAPKLQAQHHVILAPLKMNIIQTDEAG